MCGRTPFAHYLWWNKYIATPIKFHPGTPRAVEAMNRLRQVVLRNVLLRRTKQGRAADMALPCRIVTLRRDRLDPFEEDFYEAIYTQVRCSPLSLTAATSPSANRIGIASCLNINLSTGSLARVVLTVLCASRCPPPLPAAVAIPVQYVHFCRNGAE